jgi:purine-cytosine permease-like protein
LISVCSSLNSLAKPSPKSDIIGYWTTLFAAIVLTEHFLFLRKNNFDSYRIHDWDKPSKLPIGIAALLSFLGGFGIVIPSMSQVWYTGPIAKAGTGDIGVLTGTVVSATLYAILRALEKKFFLGR